MAHNSDYSRIYALPDNGLTWTEVARALGRSVEDEGQLAGDMRWDQDSQSWVRVGATNKAAKFKAVRKENTWGGKGDWWIADGKCGLGIQVYDDLADFVDAIITACKSGTAIDFNAAPLPWIYNPPRGDDAPGDIEPFRVLDFDHYNRNAVFTKPRLQTDKELTIDNAGDIDDNNLYTVDFPGDVTYPDGRTLASESLGLGDIRPTGVSGSDAPLSSYYFGIILVDCGNLSSWVVGTDDTSLGNFISGWTGMTIEGARQLSGAVANKEIAMIPFLSSVEVHGFNSESLDTITGAFLSSYGLGPTRAWVHRFGYVDLEIRLTGKSWSGSTTAGDLLGDIDIEVISGAMGTDDITLTNAQVGIQRLKNGTWVDVDGVGFTAASVVLSPDTDTYPYGTIVLQRSGYTNNIHMDDTDPEFVYGGTYRLTLYVNHSNPTELNPNTPAVVYSNSFIIP